MKLGFVGLGIMGRPMVKNLLMAGHTVCIFDLIQEAVDQMTAAGATAVGSAKEVAQQCRTVITMLPNSPHVREVVCGKDGLLEGAEMGDLLIDMSSIAPLASHEISRACQEKRGLYAGCAGFRRRTQSH